MSAPANEKPLFYVEEKKDDDFTFYVAKDEEQTVFKRLKNGPKPHDNESDKAPDIEQFSFAERIYIKNLNLTEDGIQASSEFWINLQKPARNSPHKYLTAQLDAKAKHRLAKLNPEKPDEADRDKLLEAIRTILNRAVKEKSLAKQTWAKDLSKEFSDDDTKFLSALKKKQRWQNRLILEQAFPDLIRETQAGRGLICSSYVGGYLSITFRKITESPGFKPKTHKNQNQRKQHLFSFSEYCKALYREVFSRTGSEDHAHGLLVITGATKSGKSEITRGLIQFYLEGRNESDRRRHLVTFEDPIERFFAKEPTKMTSPWAAVQSSTIVDERDYTPREKDKDASRLRDALNDALRQTPALFFVGETREKAEWKVLLDFAATGHLIVTTAHAGSLVEAMHKIFEALKVETPAERSEIASKLLGVIHIRSGDLPFKTATNGKPAAKGKSDVKPESTNILFPALWRRSPRAVASLTSDGLASLLPHRSRRDSDGNGKAGNNGDGDEPSCLGRRALIQQLFEELDTNNDVLTFLEEVFKKHGKTLEKFKTETYTKAIEWDLQGV